MFKDFKAFISRGNVLDMAIGVVIGAAFGKMIDSLVKDIIMPPLGLALNNIDFSNFYIILKEGNITGPYSSLDIARNLGATTLNIGLFLNNVVSFLIIVAAIFIFIKTINKLKSITLKETEVPKNKICEFCYSKIDFRAKKCPNCTSSLDFFNDNHNHRSS